MSGQDVGHVHGFDGSTYYCPVRDCWANRNQPGTAASAEKPVAAVTSNHRVIFHEAVCPECGSTNITETEVDTGDGITEVALLCRACGTAWPVACVVDWDGRP